MDSDEESQTTMSETIDKIIEKSSSRLIDPIPHDELPEEGPHHPTSIQIKDAIQRLLSLRRERLQDKPEWKRHVSLLLEKIDEKFPDKTIPSGTFLYHGSLNPNLDFGIGKIREIKSLKDHSASQKKEEFPSIRKLLHERFREKELEKLRNAIDQPPIPEDSVEGPDISIGKKQKKKKEKPMFFGLEPSISVWYIYELGKWEPESTIEPKKTKRHSTKTGYLYVLQVTRDIPITRIIDKLIDHPTEFSDCWKEKKGVCIHPQQIWHGDSDRVRDLGIEVTLRPREFKDHLQLMTIDPILVEKPE